MLAQDVARRYAHALFDAAQSRGLIDAGYEQMSDLRKFVAGDRTLLNFLTAPQVLDEHKRELVRTVFCNRFHQLFVEFLIVLVNKHRAGFIVEIADEFIDRVETAQGVSRAKVTSAVPLTAQEREKLIARLAVKTGRKITLEERVDPAILGGMIVIMHNEIIDGSVRHELALIEEELMRVKVS